MSGSRRCTVCGCLVLVCPTCQKDRHEYHCNRHSKWNDYYFTFLEIFDEHESNKKLEELQYEYNMKLDRNNLRRTLIKQISKIKDRLETLRRDEVHVETDVPPRCRTCSQTELVCDDLYWGYWKCSKCATLLPLDKEKQ
jgi:UDP:flavonoid glycosyltransferase YjiC (YdhE family)